MKKQRELSVPAIGGSSLLVIFSVVCLTVFALLSLNTVLAERRLSQAYGEAAQQWYGADLTAQEIFARLRAGEEVPGVEKAGDQYAYVVAISDHQTLQVTVCHREKGWEVISWQTAATPETREDTLPVWQG